MFGISTPPDTGSSRQVVNDENVQPASAAKRLEWTPEANLPQLVEQFNELMDKQQFAEAEVVALQAKKLEPDSSVVQLMLCRRQRRPGRARSRRRRSHARPPNQHHSDATNICPYPRKLIKTRNYVPSLTANTDSPPRRAGND